MYHMDTRVDYTDYVSHQDTTHIGTYDGRPLIPTNFKGASIFINSKFCHSMIVN